MEYVQQCTLHKLPQVAGHKMGRPNLTGSYWNLVYLFA